MTQREIAILGGDVPSTRILYQALKRDFAICGVIVEDRVPRRQFLLRRVRKLGLRRTLGQLLFGALVVPGLKMQSGTRLEEIREAFGLDASPIDPEKLIRVRSVNSPQAIAALQQLNPRVVVVNGTRIISVETLTAVAARFINMHAGITPRYRGVHGAYWALVERKPEACGVTVHEVDAGIDTGKILAQELVRPTEADNFITYPLLQIGSGLPALRRVLAGVQENWKGQVAAGAALSRLWSHPTLFEYLKNRHCLRVR
jgi:formyl transferase-like protein